MKRAALQLVDLGRELHHRAIVADHDQGRPIVAAGQPAHQATDGRHIEVIGWLVENQQARAAEERTRGLEQRERMLQETLVTTQRMVEEMKDNARREAQLLIKEAEMQGEKTIEAARTAEAAIQAQISQLKRTRRQLAESLRATVDMYQRLLDQDLEADASQGD